MIHHLLIEVSVADRPEDDVDNHTVLRRLVDPVFVRAFCLESRVSQSVERSLRVDRRDENIDVVRPSRTTERGRADTTDQAVRDLLIFERFDRVAQNPSEGVLRVRGDVRDGNRDGPDRV